jgi:hypothetical protein
MLIIGRDGFCVDQKKVSQTIAIDVFWRDKLEWFGKYHSIGILVDRQGPALCTGDYLFMSFQ